MFRFVLPAFGNILAFFARNVPVRARLKTSSKPAGSVVFCAQLINLFITQAGQFLNLRNFIAMRQHL